MILGGISSLISARLRYEGGRVYWRDGRSAGREAGGIRKDGRRAIRISGANFLTARVVWFLNTGRWPSQKIDHIDGVRDNDRFENLRDVPTNINARNAKRPSHNKSGVAGVHPNSRGAGTWYGQFMVDGVSHYVGTFATKEECASAVIKARQESGAFSERHGR